MKRKLFISLASAALVLSPIAGYADHDKDCKCAHGTVSAKTDNSITVDGKMFTLDSGAKVTKDGNTTALANVNVGDKVCIETKSNAGTAADQRLASKVAVLNKDEATALDRGDRTYAREKSSDLQREAHEKLCKGHHGTVTAKTDNSVTIDGKTYAMSADTRVIKGSDAAVALKKVNVGDTVCYDMQAASDGSQQVTGLMAINKDEKVRVREKDANSPNKVEVETPNKKDEAK